MKFDFSQTRIFLRPGFIDMRKAINGLSLMAETEMGMNPFSGSLFFFCGKSRRIVKAIYWDRNGFCLWQKRIEKEKFPWPVSLEATRELSEEEITMLLDGIDFFSAHKSVRYEKNG
jgi:transposase